MIKIGDIQKALIKRLKDNEIKVINNLTNKSKLPVTTVNLVTQTEEANKTLNIKETFFHVHLWTLDNSKEFIEELDKLNKALGERIDINDNVALVNTSNKVLQVLTWENNRHAVLEVSFKTVTK